MKSRQAGVRDIRRVAGAILAAVLLFVVILAVTLVVRSRMVEVESLGPATASADLRIKEPEVEEVSGGVKWRLKAAQALVFEGEGRTALERISVHVFERDRTWTIVGDEGDLFQETGNVELRRNVVLTASDGLRLETSVLRWQGVEKRLWTDAPVKMTRDGTVADGTALDVRMRDEMTTLAGRVHATFLKAPGR